MVSSTRSVPAAGRKSSQTPRGGFPPFEPRTDGRCGVGRDPAQPPLAHSHGPSLLQSQELHWDKLELLASCQKTVLGGAVLGKSLSRSFP